MGEQRFPSCRKYGIPLYGASWAPRCLKTESLPWKPENQENDQISAADNYLVLTGGGGEGRSGIRNAILLSRFDSISHSLSEMPVSEVGFGSELPYRVVVHPKGEGVLCSFPKSCMWLQWVSSQSSEVTQPTLKLAKTVPRTLEEIGQQLSMVFSHDGSVLALGGEDGELRVLKWTTMESILDKRNIYTAIKDLDFSPDGKYLASLGSGGPCRIWDVTSWSIVASLVQGKDEVFANCRFSRTVDGDAFLYVTVMQGGGSKISKWKTGSWERMDGRAVVRDSVSAFNISPDGKLLAVGTIQGNVFIINSSSTQVESVFRKAHLGWVTALAFSHDSRFLASASMDSSVRMMSTFKQKDKGAQLWLVIFVAILAIASYFLSAGRPGWLFLSPKSL